MRTTILFLLILCSFYCVSEEDKKGKQLEFKNITMQFGSKREEELFALRANVISAKMSNGNSLCDVVGESYQLAQAKLAELVAQSTEEDSRYIVEAAVMANSLKDVKRLVENGAPLVTHKYTWGLSLLHIAAIEANPDVIKYLNSAGFDINFAIPETGMTPLHLAVNSNRLDNIKALIALGANINVLSKAGVSPIFYTFACKDQNTFDYLVKQGAIVDEKTRKVAKSRGLTVN
ncbi:MAG: ankyrin repeat domain-containing protein [Psychrobium sp.]